MILLLPVRDNLPEDGFLVEDQECQPVGEQGRHHQGAGDDEEGVEHQVPVGAGIIKSSCSSCSVLPVLSPQKQAAVAAAAAAAAAAVKVVAVVIEHVIGQLSKVQRIEWSGRLKKRTN